MQQFTYGTNRTLTSNKLTNTNYKCKSVCLCIESISHYHIGILMSRVWDHSSKEVFCSTFLCNNY